MPLYASLSLLYPFSDSLIFMNSVCLSISLPGVARVKLTRPDKDNSLTQSVVYVSSLSPAPLHYIPLLFLTPLPYFLLFSRHCPSIFHPVFFHFTLLSLHHVVCYLTHILPHPASVHPSFFLAISLYVCIITDQSVFIASIRPTDFLPLPQTRPLRTRLYPSPSGLEPNEIQLPPPFSFFHSFLYNCT